MADKKTKVGYVCTSCGVISSRWEGRCSGCGEWNSMSETSISSGSKSLNGSKPLKVDSKVLSDLGDDSLNRYSTGLTDLDSVLGGGLVPGSFVLLGGEPGVGKSTLVLEVARNFPGKISYFSGEESPSQIAIRARRLGIESKSLSISQETQLTSICDEIKSAKPQLAVIDSIQTVQSSGGSVGSVALLRECAFHLLETAKTTSIPIIVTGHITKDGSIAGPKMLEHMVDTVLLFESDRLKHHRILRAVKNRFGPVGEVALYEMRSTGLESVRSISLSKDEAPGRVHGILLEGSRPICVEVQALVSRCYAGPPRRMAEGLDNRRLILMGAVLEKFLKLRLSEFDLFANLAGGLTSDDPALDLALCAAVLSSYQDEIPSGGPAFIGEVGLSGEIRAVGGAEARVRELVSQGFNRIFMPVKNTKELGNVTQSQKNVQIYPLSSVTELGSSLQRI